MLENTNVKEINNAIFILRELNADENMRRIAEVREKALHDEATAMNAAEKRGMEKGLEKGRAEVVEKMRESGMTEEQIKSILKL